MQADVPPDADDVAFEMEMYRSPSDQGGDVPGIGPVDSMYNLLGSSYTLNDHALDGEWASTLIPAAGATTAGAVTTAAGATNSARAPIQPTGASTVITGRS